MAGQDLEQRQLAKIQPIRAHVTPHEHPRRGCIYCREMRKQRRHETHLAETALLERVGGSALQELIKQTGSVTGQVVRALGLAAKGFAENPDPLSQGISLAAGLGFLTWFVLAYPDVAKATHLDRLYSFLPKSGAEVKKVIDEANSIVVGGGTFPIQSGAGPYGLRISPVTNLAFFGLTASGTYWFTDTVTRSEFRRLMTDKLGVISALVTFEDLYDASRLPYQSPHGQ